MSKKQPRKGSRWSTRRTRWHSWWNPFQDKAYGRWYVRRRVLETGKLETVLLANVDPKRPPSEQKTQAADEVKRLADLEEAEYRETGKEPVTAAYTVDAALKDWLKTKEVRAVTLRQYEQDCRSYARLLGSDKDVTTVQPTDIRHMLNNWETPTGRPKALAGRTKQKHRHALTEFFGWLIREAKVMRHNPASEMKEPAAWGKAVKKAAVMTRHPFTAEELDRLMAAATGDMLTFLLVAVHVGLRKSNLIGTTDKRAIQWGDFRDLWKPGHERIYLPSDLMKWDSPDPFDVPIHQEVGEHLRERAKAMKRVPDATDKVIALTPRDIKVEWPALMKKAQIDGHRTPHDCRATAITRWDLHCSVSVSYALEHHSPVGNVRARYTKPTHDDIRAQLARVPRLLPWRKGTQVAGG